jgi:hypothetical protein
MIFPVVHELKGVAEFQPDQMTHDHDKTMAETISLKYPLNRGAPVGRDTQ